MQKHRLFRFGISGAILAAALLSPGHASAQGNYYTCDFKTNDLATLGYTVLDTNGDGTTWTPQTSTVTFRQLDGQGIDAVTKTPTLIGNAENDDWLITPSIRFEAGKTYKVTFTMNKYNYAEIPASFEIKLGSDKKPTSMTTELLPMTGLPQLGGNSLWTFNTEVNVGTTGDYFIGIHASGKPGQKFGITNLTILNGVALVSQAAIADLKVTPDPTGDKKATITFTAPDKAKDGSTLASLSKIEIRRGEDLLPPITNPTPGTPQTVTDNVAVNGLYTYTVTAYTEAGSGDPVSATAFVGINVPTPAGEVTAANTAVDKALVTWSAPALDKDGYPIASSLIKYDVRRKPIYSSEWTTVAEDLAGLSHEDTLPAPEAPAEGEEAAPAQQFYTYAVTAKTIQGEAAASAANPVPMGTPYDAPYAESFANGRATTITTSTIREGNNYWQMTRDFEDVASSDGDNGMIFLSGRIGGAATLHTGLIDLSKIPSPTLSYYTYNIAGSDPADHEVEVVVTATDGTTRTFDRYTPAMGWTKHLCRLDEFAGKTVSVRLTGWRNNNTDLFLDNIAISTIYPLDLKAARITAPAKARSSEPFEVKVDVVNFGSEVSGDYTVSLFWNGAEVDTYSSTALGVGEYDYVAFTRTLGILDPEENEYRAEIAYADDNDTSNNATETAKVALRVNSYPVVEDLTGTPDGSSVTLSWGEPDTSKAQPYETLEDFESYDPWATSGIGDWTLVDKDKAQIAGFQEGTMPGIPDYSQQSWWIFDNTHEDFNNGSFAALSGNKFLASMVSGIQGQGYVQCDDWAISPELFGGPQTITINARSYSMIESEFETFEVLYSAGSLEPDDFVSLRVFENIPSEYKPYEADLPDGAKRFAIRSRSEGKYILMVDDVTYIPAGDPAAFTINGYNVYRDGVKVNDAPVEENEFVDTDPGTGSHDYNVTVLYSAGESKFSNTYNPTRVSVGQVGAADHWRVTTGKGFIAIDNAVTSIAVHTPDGRLAAKADAAPRVKLPLPSGIYIVTSGRSVAKVAVK